MSVLMAFPSLALHHSSASPWRVVEAELAAWAAAGRVAEFWWRDDDAVAPSAALDRVLEFELPVSLAVIPQDAEPALARHLADRNHVRVLQHGIAHRNHAPADAKRTELVAGLSLAALAEAATRMGGLFGPQLLPVLVPPWNRIAPELVAALPESGFAGLSTFGPRRRRLAAPGLVQVNTHADPVDWRARRARVPEDFATIVADALALRRLGQADAAEPVGLLTHHRLDDPAVEALSTELVSIVTDHPAARWVALAEALAA